MTKCMKRCRLHMRRRSAGNPLTARIDVAHYTRHSVSALASTR